MSLMSIGKRRLKEQYDKLGDIDVGGQTYQIYMSGENHYPNYISRCLIIDEDFKMPSYQWDNPAHHDSYKVVGKVGFNDDRSSDKQINAHVDDDVKRKYPKGKILEVSTHHIDHSNEDEFIRKIINLLENNGYYVVSEEDDNLNAPDSSDDQSDDSVQLSRITKLAGVK